MSIKRFARYILPPAIVFALTPPCRAVVSRRGVAYGEAWVTKAGVSLHFHFRDKQKRQEVEYMTTCLFRCDVCLVATYFVFSYFPFFVIIFLAS
jgi:hypothetical protein